MKKIFINNLLIILFFFFIFEILLRTFDLADLRGHGKELLEKQTNVETTVFGKKVFLDQYGYRVPNIKFSYKENAKKIIFIGDSVLFGSGVNEEETFVGKLREDNIKVTSVYPGAVDSFFWDNVNADFPRDEMMTSKEIAETVLFAIQKQGIGALEDIVIRRTKGDF